MKKNKILAAALLLACAAPAAIAKDGFMGHYGYLLTVPEGYQTSAGFEGAAEVVLFFPPSCNGKTRAECDGKGLLELTVLPKKAVKENGIGSFDEYIKAVAAGAAKAKGKPMVSRDKLAGLPSAKIYLRGMKVNVDGMFMLEGTKVYYRVKFKEKVSEKAAAALLATLTEVKPNDDPPPGQGR